MRHIVCMIGLACSVVTIARGDSFGSGANSFNINFVPIGNPGNPDDSGGGGGSYSSPYGGVPYAYRMTTTEVPAEWVAKASNLGMPTVTFGPWSNDLPATSMSWYEAAFFVNWLNETTGHQRAYDLTYSGGWIMNLWSSGDAWQLGGENRYRHKDAFYFLPSEDEWYKAAYHHNNGVTGDYWDYATGSNAVPDGIDYPGDPAFDAVFVQPGANPTPNSVFQAGVAGAYGTYGQAGNVVEWMESAADGVNDSVLENRAFRDNSWNNGFGSNFLVSSFRGGNTPGTEGSGVGFRVASVIPEPSAAALLVVSSALLIARRGHRMPA